MKKFVAGLILSVIVIKGISQNKGNSSATYNDSIPLLIVSKLFVTTLYPDNTFVLLSERLRISLAQRVGSMNSEFFFGDTHKAAFVGKTELNRIEYRFVNDQNFSTSWNILPRGALLSDTLLQPGNLCRLQFRRKGSTSILEHMIFQRKILLPEIFSYREKNPTDSFDGKLKSKAAYSTMLVMPGFKRLPTKTVAIRAGKQVEFQFANYSISKDSSILYRLKEVTQPDSFKWKITGHLLNINSLRSNRKYTLEVKFAGTDSFKTYLIDVPAFWWEENWAISMFILLSIVLIRLAYKYYLHNRQIKRKRTIEKLKSLKHKLNPHFVGNAASTIVSLVAEKQNDSASAYLSALADLMIDSLEDSNQLFVRLSDEIKALERYLSLECLRFGFRYEFEIEPALDLHYLEILPMLLQPSVENAIKHGVSGMKDEGTITISFSKRDLNLVITIKDNGKWKEATKIRGHGNGIAITKERIELLGSLHPNEKIDFQIEHLCEGTIVTFCFENYLR